ncbi:uncharacterized protein [Oscarella lobularis]|uniref:uncharacterized protein n=1 Tax=Oscarella lobularis TaxID=121494 RepID=UPI0033137A0E
MASKAKPRIKSAHPRFAGPSPEPEEAEPSGGGRTGSAARRRVQSAKERKQSHDASEVFPVANDLTSPSQVGMRWKTSYKADFQSRQGTRSEPRPTSATRRNNPHPNQSFMNWRVPSRRLSTDGDEFDGLAKALQKDAQENFQFDYKDAQNDGDARNEVLTGVAKLRMVPESREYGRHLVQPSPGRLPAMPRRPVPKQEFPDFPSPPKETKTARPDSIGVAVRPEHVPAVDDWLKGANQKEQQAVLSMLKAAEDAHISEVVQKTLHPQATPAVEKWLQEAKPEDRSVALRLLNTISPPSGDRPPSRLQRRASSPARLVAPSSFLRRHPSAPPVRDPHRRMSVPAHLHDALSTSKPPVWHHRSVRNYQQQQGPHRGSIFGGAPRMKSSHFTIHPEWQSEHA